MGDLEKFDFGDDAINNLMRRKIVQAAHVASFIAIMEKAAWISVLISVSVLLLRVALHVF